MLCSQLKKCILRIKNVDQPGREPVFRNVTGSTLNPGQFGAIFDGHPISAYDVLTVPADRIFVLEYARPS